MKNIKIFGFFEFMSGCCIAYFIDNIIYFDKENLITDIISLSMLLVLFIVFEIMTFKYLKKIKGEIKSEIKDL